MTMRSGDQPHLNRHAVAVGTRLVVLRKLPSKMEIWWVCHVGVTERAEIGVRRPGVDREYFALSDPLCHDKVLKRVKWAIDVLREKQPWIESMIESVTSSISL